MVFKRQPAATGKSTNLNLAESHDGLIQAPQEYSPFVNMKLAKHQQEVVLSRMQQDGLRQRQPQHARKNQTWQD